MVSAAFLTPVRAACAEVDRQAVRDIIVTAQLRPQDMQDVPIAVSPFAAEALERPYMSDIRDLAGAVPGLVVDTINSGPQAAAIALRGIAFNDVEKSFDPAIGVAVDGVFVGTSTGQLRTLFDVQSIEVLRGPQGTLFGANTIGGVIAIKRADPTGKAGFKGMLGLAEQGTGEAAAVINLPRIGDRLAVQAYASRNATGGYYDNATLHRTAGHDALSTLGATVLVDASSRAALRINYEHVRERGETQLGSLSMTPNPAFGAGNDLICLQIPGTSGPVRAFGVPDAVCDRAALGANGLYTTFGNLNAPLTNDGNSVSARATNDFGDGFKLVAITGYQDNRENVVQDLDSTPIDFLNTYRQQFYRQFSQEFQVHKASARYDIVVGLYYFFSRYVLDQRTDFGANAIAHDPVELWQHVDQQTRSRAAFADVELTPVPRVTLGLGSRYTRDDKAMFNNYGQPAALVHLSQPDWTTQCIAPSGFIGATAIPAYGPANTCDKAARFGRLTWRTTGQYAIGDHRMVYASYARGFRSGGFNGRAASPTSLGPYQPETVDAWELGAKADWLDRRLRTNVAGFLSTYHQKQEDVIQPSPQGSADPNETVVKNAAAARIKGIEAEAVFQPTAMLRLDASTSLQDGRYLSFYNSITPAGVIDDVASLTMRRAPRATWSLGAHYARPAGRGTITFSARFRHVSSYAACIAPDPAALQAHVIMTDRRCVVEPHATLDAALVLAVPVNGIAAKLSLYGRNILDNRGLEAVLPIAGLFTPSEARPPRQIGTRLDLAF